MLNSQAMMRVAVCATLGVVCLLGVSWCSSQCVSGQETDSHASHVYRPGLRNSFAAHRLNAKELNLVLTQLRRKTGFVRMRFDEAGFLRIDDRSQFSGGSAYARELLLAAVDGRKSIQLESHNRSPEVVFGRVSGNVNYTNHRGDRLIVAAPVEIDFSDFDHLRGERRVKEAFDPGFVILHELCHIVLELRDPEDEENAAGDCERYVNRIRRELGMPERQQYTATIYRTRVFPDIPAVLIAELSFAQIEAGRKPESRAKKRRLRLNWDVHRVGTIERHFAQLSRKNK